MFSLADYDASDFAPEPSYRFHCPDRMCGANDCGNCRNGAPPWEEAAAAAAEAELEEEVEDRIDDLVADLLAWVPEDEETLEEVWESVGMECDDLGQYAKFAWKRVCELVSSAYAPKRAA